MSPPKNLHMLQFLNGFANDRGFESGLYMNIAILGYGREGQAAYAYWRSKQNDITICDIQPATEFPTNVETRLGENYLTGLGGFDLIVRSPGIHPAEITKANPATPDILSRVTSVTNEFFRVSPTKNIIGVTGTKGKGTTSTLIAHMLEAAGKIVHLGGNIGIPALSLLKNDIKPDDWIVLELSNFQLIDLMYSPHIAVCLMIEPEHLNWHANLDEYIDAKRQLFRYQTEDDIAVFYADNNYSRSIAEGSPAVPITYMSVPGAEVKQEEKIVVGDKEICNLSDIRLLGRHNWQNICAAVTVVWQICPDPAALRQAIAGFVGLPHRLEVVREVDGVRYFNDSFASAPGAVIAAMDAIPGMKVMIVGGFDKGLEFDELARAMIKHRMDLRRVVLIGSVARRIESELKAHGFTNYDLLTSKKITDIVKHARECARAGDSIVLSPGSSSFDMFKDFEDRGIQYKDAVNALV